MVCVSRCTSKDGRCSLWYRLWLLLLALGVIIGAPRSSAQSARFGYQITDLGTLGGDQTFATSLNDRGHVAGYSQTATGASHAFLWEEGQLQDLGTLGGENSVARSINRQGHVVDSAETAAGATHAIVWKSGVPRDLGLLPRGSESEGTGINKRLMRRRHGNFQNRSSSRANSSVFIATLRRQTVPREPFYPSRSNPSL